MDQGRSWSFVMSKGASEERLRGNTAVQLQGLCFGDQHGF